MKDSYPRKSRWAVFGRDPLWWHRLLLAEWNSQILPPISESPSTRTAADTAARSPAVCAAAIPNNRPRGPALNLTPAKNWPRRNYASHILYDNIMRTRRPLDPCTRHILQWKTKLPSKYSGGPSPQLYYGKVKVWVKGRLYKDLSCITILQGLWTCGHWPAPSFLKWVWWPDDTDDH